MLTLRRCAATVLMLLGTIDGGAIAGSAGAFTPVHSSETSNGRRRAAGQVPMMSEALGRNSRRLVYNLHDFASHERINSPGLSVSLSVRWQVSWREDGAPTNPEEGMAHIQAETASIFSPPAGEIINPEEGMGHIKEEMTTIFSPPGIATPTPAAANDPSPVPSALPSAVPATLPTEQPTTFPTTALTAMPTATPSNAPSPVPSVAPSPVPSVAPTAVPTDIVQRTDRTSRSALKTVPTARSKPKRIAVVTTRPKAAPATPSAASTTRRAYARANAADDSSSSAQDRTDAQVRQVNSIWTKLLSRTCRCVACCI